MSVLDDPEQKKAKKLRKCLKNAAYAIGGAVGLLFLGLLWPEQEGAEKITDLFGGLSLCLLTYGFTIALVFAFRRAWVLPVNFFMIGLVVPGWVIALLLQTFQGQF